MPVISSSFVAACIQRAAMFATLQKIVQNALLSIFAPMR
jgi:hypothetical protein